MKAPPSDEAIVRVKCVSCWLGAYGSSRADAIRPIAATVLATWDQSLRAINYLEMGGVRVDLSAMGVFRKPISQRISRKKARVYR